jgi:post-segregation antitoxin (ccd killing protein)
MSEVVTAKVPKELRERARKYHIEISGLVRRALEAEVAKAEERELREELERVATSLKGKFAERDLVKAVRETRDEN